MKITIVDDDAIVVMSLKTILEASGDVEVLATGKNGQDALKIFTEHQPDVMLIDIQMPVLSGLSAAEMILSAHKHAKILFLTTFADEEYIYKALSIGAKGYILKQDFDNILPALKAVVSGSNVFGSDIVDKLAVTKNQISSGIDYQLFDINEKEQNVILGVANGLNNKEISEKLFLSEGTVRNYISNILLKLDLRDRTQLAIWYYQNK